MRFSMEDDVLVKSIKNVGHENDNQTNHVDLVVWH